MGRLTKVPGIGKKTAALKALPAEVSLSAGIKLALKSLARYVGLGSVVYGHDPEV